MQNREIVVHIKRRATPMPLREAVPSLWDTFRHLWPHVRRERASLVGAFASLAFGIILRLLEPWPLKLVFDGAFAVAVSGVGDTVPLNFRDRWDANTIILMAALATVVFTALRALADYFNTIGFARVGSRVLTAMRNQLFRHLQQLSLAFHSEARGGDLILRVMSDVNVLKEVAVTAIMPLVSAFFVLMGMVAVMLWMDWRLALVSLATLPVLARIAYRLSGEIREAAGKQRKREGALAAAAAESIGAIKIVQALSLEEKFAESFVSGSDKSQHEDLRVRRLSGKLERSVDVMMGISTGLVLLYGGNRVLSGALTPGDLLVFITYLKRAFNPIQDFAKYTGRLAKAAAAGERVTNLLGRVPDVRDLPHAQIAPAFRGEVRLEQVSFCYKTGHPVLDKIDLEVRPGERVALVGSSGVGKSTLVSLLLRLYDPTGGSILIDGKDLREYTLSSLRQQISVVLQDSVLFAAAIWENIAHGAQGATRIEIEAAARLANADDFIRKMPQGYDTVVGERGTTLSGGQRQRIAIARAALRKSPILILDEPTTGLDETSRRLVMEALERLAEGRSTFVIAHDLELARIADQILYLHKGRIVERGDHAALMRQNGQYALLYRLQMSAMSTRSERHVVAS